MYELIPHRVDAVIEVGPYSDADRRHGVVGLTVDDRFIPLTTDEARDLAAHLTLTAEEATANV